MGLHGLNNMGYVPPTSMLPPAPPPNTGSTIGGKSIKLRRKWFKKRKLTEIKQPNYKIME